jgi:hypothetical protein
MLPNYPRAWDQRDLREMAKAARTGFHIKQDVARAFDAAVIVDAKRPQLPKRWHRQQGRPTDDTGPRKPRGLKLW